MGSIAVSSKGQVVIPKDVRQRLGIVAGSQLELIEGSGELRLRPLHRPGKTATAAEGRGLAGYVGRKVSIAEMNRAVLQAAAAADAGSRAAKDKRARE